jgi:arylsulfatase A-like enzyme
MSMARLALCAAVLAGALAIFALTRDDSPEAPEGAPNIIVVMTDDQSMNSYSRETMPNAFRLFDDGGTRFSDAYAMPPLCCPARATFQTGQYPHNHGVVQNFYEQLREPDNTLGVWLDRGGYNVGLSGKFMNGYYAEEPAPGFDYWWELRANPGYYNYQALDGTELVRPGDDPDDYSTLAVTRNAVEFVREAAAGDDPFFLWASYYAPHSFSRDSERVCGDLAAQVLPEDWRLFKDSPVHFPPAFDEADISDKPAPSRTLLPLSDLVIEDKINDIRCARAAVHRVDVGIGEILDELEAAGVEDETAIFFISDNGLFFGEHRRPYDKAVPYEAVLEVPMAAHIPAGVLGSEPVPEVDEPTGTLDLAPTILDLAGAEPCNEDECRVMDGRSLLDLVRGDDPTWPRDRARLSELGKGCGTYASVERGDWMYSEWYEGEPPDCETIGVELYDLAADPHQLDNLLGIPETRSQPDVKAKAEQMAALLEEMRQCNGIEGRDETEDPC